jgi:hypothetical protein
MSSNQERRGRLGRTSSPGISLDLWTGIDSEASISLHETSRLLTSIVYRKAARFDTDDESQILLTALREVVRIKPRSLEGIAGEYYKLLGEICRQAADDYDGHLLEVLRDAVVAPLVVDRSFGTSILHYLRRPRQ